MLDEPDWAMHQRELYQLTVPKPVCGAAGPDVHFVGNVEGRDIMTADVKTVSPSATFAKAARVLSDNRISSVVVKDAEHVAGIVTERDVVRAGPGEALAPAAPPAGRLRDDGVPPHEWR